MTEAERRYTTYERESLVAIFSLNIFPINVLSSHLFKQFADHKSLSYTFKKKEIWTTGKLDGFSSLT